MEKSSYLVKIKPDTRRALDEIGKKTETYDDIIRRLLREAGYLDEEGNIIKRA